MDVGSTNSWNYDSVVSGDEMRKIIGQEFGQLEQVESNYRGEVANLWKIQNGGHHFVSSKGLPPLLGNLIQLVLIDQILAQ